MPLILSAPARINLLGNPSDANEGDYATISAAIDLFAHAQVRPAQGMVLESDTQQEVFDPNDIPLSYGGELNLMKGAVNRLHNFSGELRTKLKKQGIHIKLWSDVPRQSGLGGSSLSVLLTLAALVEFYDLDRRQHNAYTLAEITQRVESKELGITCGFADRYVPLLGGIAYVDYRGKLLQAEIHQEPLATYEKLDAWVKDLPLVAITTGIQHDSGDVHGRMRPRFIAEYLEWQERGGPPPPLVDLMQGAWQTAWQGKIALLENDLDAVGRLMNHNHALVDRMMQLCGFQDGAGWANNLCIRTALENGALGAKLTGAGGGGSVFALVKPGEESRLAQSWQNIAEEHNLDQAAIFIPKICHQGLVAETGRESD